ncbi:MAG: hypothetical protein MUC47_07795 [Candidatus Kapabacteria bacterium]|nr:hypothetical protein [Candidatus Kapabacteria bacterium]
MQPIFHDIPNNTNPDMLSIAVVGTSSPSAASVVDAMIQAGMDVTIGSVFPYADARRFPKAHIQHCNVFDADSVALLLEGRQAVYVEGVMQHGQKESDHLMEREGLRTLLAIGHVVGIERICYRAPLMIDDVSDGHKTWWVHAVQRQAVDTVCNGRIPYTVYRTSSFMEDIAMTCMWGRRALVAGRGARKHWFIALADYARQVVRSLVVESTLNTTYPIQGAEGFTLEQAFEVWQRVRPGHAPRLQSVPLPLLHAAALFYPRLRSSIKEAAAMSGYSERFQAERTWRDLGRPRISLEQFFAQWKGALPHDGTSS